MDVIILISLMAVYGVIIIWQTTLPRGMYPIEITSEIKIYG